MRTRSNANERLRSIPMFRDCSTRDLSVVARLMDRVDLAEGRVLVREGRPGSECFVIDEGTVSVTRGGDEVAMLGPGDVLGELAILSGGTRDATGTAATPVSVYVLHQAALRGVLSEVPSVRNHLFQVLAKRLREAEAPAMAAAH
jgi:CRP/FNR family cyclic AMP-dependent transcriptional regulator